MKTNDFLTQLVSCTGLAALSAWALHQIESLAPYSDLSLLSGGGFVVFSLALFWAARRAAADPDERLFVRLFWLATALKMILCVLLVLWYSKTHQPNTPLFVLPFFAVYAIFTGFEVHFLGKLSKTQREDGG